MLKKDFDRIKKERKALIARECQDLPLPVAKPQASVTIAHDTAENSTDCLQQWFNYSGVIVVAVVVLLVLI